MSKIEIANKLHKTFGSVKNVSLFVFAIVMVLATLGHSKAFGESLVPSVDTKVSVSFDNKSKTFIATQNTVEGALRQGGIELAKNDITSPARDSLLNGQEVNVKVTRQVPVLISDNNQEFMANSAYSDPHEILKQVDVAVFPEDRVNATLILDPVDEHTIGQKIVIERAPSFTVSVDGSEQVIRSWGKTINEVLQGKISLGQRDIVEPPLEASSVGDGRIDVTRVNVVESEENVAIAFETVYKNDYSMYQGQSKVTQAGANGLKKENIRITYHNGEVVDRTVLSSEILENSTTKIVVKGVKPYNAGAWWDTLVAAGGRYGISPIDMYNVMNCESHGNPFAGSYYKGLFQYSPNTWAGASAAAGYAGASITDGTAQIYVTAWKVNHDGGWSSWSCKP